MKFLKDLFDYTKFILKDERGIIGLALGAAALGAGAGFLSAKAKNKALSGFDEPFEPFSGQKPSIPQNLRKVEGQIDDILLRRSLGTDVGFDPARRQALLEQFQIAQDQQSDVRRSDQQDFLSGAGLSRNVAAREALIGRGDIEQDRESNKFRLGVDIEDLARRNEERDINTARLQQQSGLKFGQQQARSAFDLDVFNAESGNEATRRGFDFQSAQLQQSPTAQALLGGLGGGLAASGIGSPQSLGQSQTPISPTGRFNTGGNNQGVATPFLNQERQRLLAQKGLNLVN